MSDPRPLRNAPITEALLDLRVQPAEGRTVDDLDAATKQVAEDFPNREEQYQVAGRLELKAGDLHTTSERTRRGLIFRNDQGTRVVQFRIDGFTISHLKPYKSWECLLRDAQELWSTYVEVAEPAFVTRIAARYINHIKLPMPIQDFADYLVCGPTLPDAVPQVVSGFLSRVTIVEEQTGLRAHITQNLLRPDDDEHLPFLLDIDVFCNREVQIGDPEMWDTFGKMRRLKNTIFFESLTDKTIEFFS